MSHFEGKAPLQHVIDARLKGRLASVEVHGQEMPGHISAGADAAKETALLLLLLWTLLGLDHPLFMVVLIGAYAVWKTGRSALLGWSRLERLHRVIEEERWEIEHHRPQEKEELTELYAAKGLSGKLLNEVVEVLMADDNRLLQVMLEEELGLNLQSYEHPLKQAAGAFVGVVTSALFISLGLFFLPNWGFLLCVAIVIGASAYLTARFEKNQPTSSIIWNLSIASLACGFAYFLSQILL